MSVLIRDMKMPKNCCQCEWHEYCGGDYDCCHACRRTGAMPIKNAERERNYDCPLVEIKAPHGRLIDADALHLPPEEIASRMAVQCAPTVIKAEDE